MRLPRVGQLLHDQVQVHHGTDEKKTLCLQSFGFKLCIPFSLHLFWVAMAKQQMNAAQLRKTIAKRAGMTHREVGRVLAKLRDIAGENLSTVGHFRIPGVCAFRVRLLPARKQPRTTRIFGKEVKFSSRGGLQSVRASASKTLKNKALAPVATN